MFPRCGNVLRGATAQNTRYQLKRYSTVKITRNEQHNQWRKVFEDYRVKNSFSLQDWHQINPQKLDEATSRILQDNFKGSLYSALKNLYPEEKWNRQMLKPRSSRVKLSNPRKFLDDLGSKLGIQKLEDWYNVLSCKLLLEHGGRSLLARHKNSSIEAIRAVYPEHNWIPWKFTTVPQGFWKSPKNQRQFFDWLGKELGVKKLDDWYPLVNRQIMQQHGGTRILNLHGGSPSDALMNCYPEHDWIPWKFSTLKHGFWKSMDNQKRFFEWLAKQQGVSKLDDWYHVITAKLVISNGGSGLLLIHNNSPMEALRACYPEHNWTAWKFTSSPLGSWDSKENITQFMNHLSEKLSIQTLDDWYRVDQTLLVHFGAASLLKKYGGLYKILKIQYPHHPWKSSRFQYARKGQRWLAVTLQRLFPGEEILEDYMHPKAFSPTTKRPLQLDVFIPSRSIAFEYQGKQHYENVGIFQPSSIYQKRDEEKREICKENNIQLIEVPYWWNRTEQGLQDFINNPLSARSAKSPSSSKTINL